VSLSYSNTLVLYLAIFASIYNKNIYLSLFSEFFLVWLHFNNVFL
jgi:hypothetical protein